MAIERREKAVEERLIAVGHRPMVGGWRTAKMAIPEEKYFTAVPQAGGPILQLLHSHARQKLQQEFLRKHKQNLTN